MPERSVATLLSPPAENSVLGWAFLGGLFAWLFGLPPEILGGLIAFGAWVGYERGKSRIREWREDFVEQVEGT